MKTDLIAEQIAWLDDIITNPDNLRLFENPVHTEIATDLADCWKTENRLDFLNALADAYNENNVLQVIDTIIAENCRKNWAQAGQETENSMDKFIEMLWKPLIREGFVYTYNRTGNVTKFRVTKCPMAELAHKIGAEKWLYHLVCLTDGPSISGFNPAIHFSRTRTIMQGCADCDHTYTDNSI